MRWDRPSAAAAILGLALLAVSGVRPQLDHSDSDSDSDSDECRCRPPCRPLTPDEAAACPWNRTVRRADRWSSCPCCRHPLCARQAGQSCNGDVLACDGQLGLECDEDTGTCSGPFHLRAVEVGHNSTLLRWRNYLRDVRESSLRLLVSGHLDGNETVWEPAANSSREDGVARVENLTPNTVFYLRLTDGHRNSEVVIVKTADGCPGRNSTSYGLGEEFSVGCEEKCVCQENGVARCRPRCAAQEPRIHCQFGPDPHDECCTIRTCEERSDGHGLVAGEPQVIVTGRTPDSLTVAWDDFKVPGPTFDHGYVVEYRPAVGGSAEASSWTRIPVENAPFTTIRNLKPNTAYEVRVFIWEDMESKKYGPSTEIMVLFTQDGCLWEDRSLDVGAKYFKGCEAKCTCVGNGTSECGSRCEGRFKPMGSAANHSGCEEEAVEEDECCVVLRCTSVDDEGANHSLVAQKVHSVTLTFDGECPRRIPDPEGSCRSDCTSDNDCRDQRCCLTDCGSTVCIPPKTPTSAGQIETELLPITVRTQTDPCSELRCGPNAVCREIAGNARCLCLPGFSGNPHDGQTGCLSVETELLSVTVRPRTDPCSKLGCGPNAVCREIAENARCHCLPGFSGNPYDGQNGCLSVTVEQTQTTVVSPRIDPCSEHRCGPNAVCREIFADARCLCLPGFSGNPYNVQLGCVSATQPPAPPKSKSKAGCTFGNATYLEGETFYSGCESKCECANKDGKYEIACQPRCAVKEEKFRHFDSGCRLQPDPKDECCKVLVCEAYHGTDDDFVMKNETLFEDGCEYKGKMYGVEEHFYDGCESSCLCLGMGEIDCNPRCPATPEVKSGCVVVPHPSDSECCKVVICNPLNLNFTLHKPLVNETLDVAGFDRINSTDDPELFDDSDNETDVFATTEVAFGGQSAEGATEETTNGTTKLGLDEGTNATTEDSTDESTFASTESDDGSDNATLGRHGGDERLFNESDFDGVLDEEDGNDFNDTSSSNEDPTTEFFKDPENGTDAGAALSNATSWDDDNSTSAADTTAWDDDKADSGDSEDGTESSTMADGGFTFRTTVLNSTEEEGEGLWDFGNSRNFSKNGTAVLNSTEDEDEGLWDFGSFRNFSKNGTDAVATTSGPAVNGTVLDDVDSTTAMDNSSLGLWNESAMMGDEGFTYRAVLANSTDAEDDGFWNLTITTGRSKDDDNKTVSGVEGTTNKQKEMRQLEDEEDDSRSIQFPKHEGRTAAIFKIVVINPTTVRMQILMAAPVMEKMFMDSEAILVLFTTNLTDLVDWNRHPLSLQHNVGFVSVDRSDVAAETIIGDLQPDRQYNFVVVRRQENVDPDLGMRFEQLSEIEATVTIQLGEGMCEFMGKSFRIGERMYEECQAVCDCLPGQLVHCEAIVCPHQISPEKSGCLEWNVDTSVIPRAPLCCQEATCKYGSMCIYKGRKFRNLEKIPHPLVDECDQECKCVAGNVTCLPRCQHVPLEPPADMECPSPKLQLVPGDECCKRWHCDQQGKSDLETSINGDELEHTTMENITDDDNATTVDPLHDVVNVTSTAAAMTTEADLQLAKLECVYGNASYKLNEQWRDGKGHRQKLCSCILLPNGTALTECQGGCPPILKQHMDLIPDCPPENVVIWDVPELCPYALCNKTEIGRGIKNVTVETLNATAIRVNFVIPNIYVGLYGHIEILYTMDLSHSEDTTTWSKEVFSGQSNQFESVRLSHEMTGLQPDTKYSLKVLAIIKNTKNMDSSEVITITMPPLPTTTTTTTTTTLPPKISIDVRLNVTDVQISSATVRWRTLEPSERRFIDGVHLRYKLHEDQSQQWSKTMMIHRDVTSFTLDHLKPDSDYDVEIVAVPPANVATEIFAGVPIMFRTLPIHDDFEFNLTLTIDKVTAYAVELIWTGVPYPEHKYINVYKFLYQQISKDPANGNAEASFIYRPPKGNQFQFTVERLAPETNYSVWMEAILSNGKVRTSNVINVTTKPGPIAPLTSEKEKLEANMDNGTKSSGNAYYAALIVVAVIAALCALGFVILLVILLKKQSSAKAPITSSKSHSAYDNPTYKDSLE